MDILKILSEAFDIGNKTSYEINLFKGNTYIETKTMTYTELGILLISNNDNIHSISIILNEQESENYNLDGNDKETYLIKH